MCSARLACLCFQCLVNEVTSEIPTGESDGLKLNVLAMQTHSRYKSSLPGNACNGSFQGPCSIETPRLMVLSFKPVSLRVSVT